MLQHWKADNIYVAGPSNTSVHMERSVHGAKAQETLFSQDELSSSLKVPAQDDDDPKPHTVCLRPSFGQHFQYGQQLLVACTSVIASTATWSKVFTLMPMLIRLQRHSAKPFLPHGAPEPRAALFPALHIVLTFTYIRQSTVCMTFKYLGFT